MYRTVHLTAIAVLLVAAALPAQDSATTVAPGRMIRIKVLNGGETEGTILAVDSARIRIAVSGTDTVVIPRGEVARIDIYQGMHSQIGKGALTGGIIGLAIGAVLGAASASATEGSFIEYSAGEGAVAYGLTFGVIGATAGVLAGIKKRPTWKPAQWPTVFVAPAGPQGSGVAVGLHLEI